MDFYGVRDMTRDGPSVMKFLCGRYERTRTIRCISCKSEGYNFQNRGYLRCDRCRTDYNPFKKTKFKAVNITMIKWMVLIYMFDMESSALLASKQAGVSYPATLKAFDCMRGLIVNEMAKTDKKLRGVFELDEAYFGGKRKGNRGRMTKNKTVVFGILERKGKVRVAIVKNAGAKILLKNTIKAVKRGSVTYTDKWHGYDTLVVSGYKHHQINHSKAFAYNKFVHINGIEGFWSYAKQRMAKYHGVKPSKFFLYIKEMERRYNNRDKDMFIMLMDYFLKR